MRYFLSIILCLTLLGGSYFYFSNLTETAETSEQATAAPDSVAEDVEDRMNLDSVERQTEGSQQSQFHDSSKIIDLLAISEMDEAAIRALLKSDDFKDRIQRLSSQDALRLLNTKGIEKNTFLMGEFIKLILEVRWDDISEDDTWIEGLSFYKSKNPSGVNTLKRELARRHPRFRASEIAKTIALGDLGADDNVRIGITNRLYQVKYEEGEGGQFANALEYLSKLPDSKIRDQIYAVGYLEHLGKDEILNSYEQVLGSEYYNTGATDASYAGKLIHYGEGNLAMKFYNEVLASGQRERAGSIAGVIAARSGMDPVKLFEWTRELPADLEGKNQTIIYAFFRLAKVAPVKAKSLINSEKDSNLRQNFERSYDFHQQYLRREKLRQ